ncbi:MAG: prepilin-type N-terminal cleavage/methylation domain-containing protein [Elusimicrobiaceae bacterium]|nr:prepilin-type N-terminal cleavage/methylation domain-containing protein [Elusimicrobiaceae bacterium]
MKKGFTLIELLVVVLIIGILSAVALPQYERAVARARLSEILVVSRAVENAERLYFMANGDYSYNFEDLDISLPAGATKGADNFFYVGDLRYSLEGPVGGARLHAQSAKLPIVFQTLFWVNFNQCIVTNSNKKVLAEYLCKSIGGVNPSPQGTGATIYQVPK